MRSRIMLLGLLLLSAAPPASEPRQELVRGWYLQSTDTIEQAFQLRLQEFTQIRPAKFLGATIRGGMHEVTREPLRCVERYIRQRCGADPYRIKNLSGWRAENSFKKQKNHRRQEYSNHIFGLALYKLSVGLDGTVLKPHRTVQLSTARCLCDHDAGGQVRARLGVRRHGLPQIVLHDQHPRLAVGQQLAVF